jgi:hypothetical protein
VASNRRWLETHFAPKGGPAPARAPAAKAAPAAPAAPVTRAPLPAEPPEPGAPLSLDEGDWGSLFDAGDEAVQLGLKKPRS